MSKEIAQTVGGKRIAWLIAIVAAFAVFATVGSNWRDAKADVTAADWCVDEYLGETPVVTECTADASPFPNPDVIGATRVYKVSMLPLTVGTAGNLQVVLNSDELIISVTTPSGPTPTCVITTSAGDSTATCTYPGPLAAGTSATLLVTTQVNDLDNSQYSLVFWSATVQDLGSAQGAIDIADYTDPSQFDILRPRLTIDKTHVGVPTSGSAVTYNILVGNNGTGANASATGVTVSDTLPPAYASVTSATSTQGTCTIAALTVNCNIGTLAVGATATVTIVGQLNVVTPGTTVNVSNTATATSNLASLMAAGTVSDTDAFTIVVAGGGGAGDLVHIDPATGLVLPNRDVENNVIGFLHGVCALNNAVDAVWPNTLATLYTLPTQIGAPIVTGQGSNGLNFKIDTISGTSVTTGATVLTGVDCDQDGFNDDSRITWYSTSAGEQNITVVDDAGSTVLDWDGPVAPGDVVNPLVKEWNTLVPTTITASAGTAAQAAGSAASGNLTNLDGAQGTLGVTFNPATGAYQSATGASVYENVLASHTNAAGTQLYFAQGARVTFTATGTCGSFTLTGGFVPASAGTLPGVADDYLIPYRPSGSTTNVTSNVSVTTTGAPIKVTLNTNANCTLGGGTVGFSAAAAYPTLLGSDQPPAPAVETYSVRLVVNIAEKQVFLAWAGQRVILEHDWRINAGDVDGGGSNSVANLGECVFDGSSVGVTYLKGSGPGNFLPGQGVTVNGSDQATVHMDANDDSQTDGEDIVGNMNGMCISRVLYESEDQGQVDIEAFVDGSGSFNYTKVAFVIYYMKINTINVSLVTQVSKPTHNGSSAADYAPGNPWDASKDDADNAADWNVSKDLLVRGRVTGWFKNSNPSGRAADTSNPLNVLPADRWVMPQDWPLLAGGPADPADGSDAVGTAEQFRPYYDIMFAPNNTRNIALSSPTGQSLIQVTTVTAIQVAGSKYTVGTCADIALVGAVTIGSSSASATCVGTTLTTALSAAVGNGVFISTGAPFEGPYSTLDIIGLASQGLGGAALSDIDPNNIRDTMLDDGDVDMWDAPMPAAPVSVAIRGTGFLKQVIKSDVYYLGTANSSAQVYPNPYYIQDIPASPFIPAVVAGGGYLWNTWGNDGPGGNGDGVYRFWQPAIVGTNSEGVGDGTVTAAQATELAAIRAAYGDNTIARDLVVYTDNHGEFMVTANGDFKTDLTACATNVLAGGKHCKPGDKVGTGTITATVDYPDFRGKHFPVLSNAATVTWLWGGYKDVTVEKGETDQFKYIVFHAMDRDGFCAPPTGAVLLHSVLSSVDAATTIGSVDPVESVDFLIDSGEGIIIGQSGGGTINDGKQFATGLTTFSTAANDPATSGILEFPLSSLAASGATDECQAWIKVSNSLLGILNVLAIAHDDEGNIGFDKIIDLTNTTSYTLNFRWSLITWAGANDISVSDAIKGTGTSGKNPGGNDISASVTAIYGWEAATQDWLGYFPSGVNVPGANDLTVLKTGQAYWIAITGPSSVTWTIASNVN